MVPLFFWWCCHNDAVHARIAQYLTYASLARLPAGTGVDPAAVAAAAAVEESFDDEFTNTVFSELLDPGHVVIPAKACKPAAAAATAPTMTTTTVTATGGGVKEEQEDGAAAATSLSSSSTSKPARPKRDPLDRMTYEQAMTTGLANPAFAGVENLRRNNYYFQHTGGERTSERASPHRPACRRRRRSVDGLVTRQNRCRVRPPSPPQLPWPWPGTGAAAYRTAA